MNGIINAMKSIRESKMTPATNRIRNGSASDKATFGSFCLTAIRKYTEDVSRKGVDSKTANSQDSLWITRPERNLGSNHVVFGGMILPLSAISISCFMETG